MKINDPLFNLRELTKQLVLLEQHLLEKGKYCPDCISKHLLCIEALAEEGECLDATGRTHQTFRVLAHEAKRWASAFTAGARPQDIGQEVRRIRKQLAQHVLDPEYGAAPADTDLAGMGPESFGVSNGGTFLVLLALAGTALWWAEKHTKTTQQLRLEASR